MILFPGRHLIGVLECHQFTPCNKMVELTWRNPAGLPSPYFSLRLSNLPQRLSFFHKIRENLYMAASIQKITIQALSFLATLLSSLVIAPRSPPKQSVGKKC
jgi:hypothetical protein